MLGGVRAGDIDEEVDDTGERGGEGEGVFEESSEGMAGIPENIRFLVQTANVKE